jgi:hypothetical protein
MRMFQDIKGKATTVDASPARTVRSFTPSWIRARK